MVSSRRRPIEYVSEEKSAAPQSLLIDRVADAYGGHRLDRDIGALERGFRLGERGVRDEWIVGAVNKKSGRTRTQLIRQQFGSEQPAREADNAGDWLIAPKPDIERHHRALREPDERQIAVVEPSLRERIVDKGVEDRRRRPHAGQRRLGGTILRAVPLVAMGSHVARERCVR